MKSVIIIFEDQGLGYSPSILKEKFKKQSEHLAQNFVYLKIFLITN